MSDENPTAEQPDARPFEERVFARLDSIDARLTRLEESAERRAMETKPIWERALAEIVETRRELTTFRREMGLEMRVVHEDARRVRVEQEDLKDRVSALENRPA